MFGFFKRSEVAGLYEQHVNAVSRLPVSEQTDFIKLAGHRAIIEGRIVAACDDVKGIKYDKAELFIFTVSFVAVILAHIRVTQETFNFFSDYFFLSLCHNIDARMYDKRTFYQDRFEQYAHLYTVDQMESERERVIRKRKGFIAFNSTASMLVKNAISGGHGLSKESYAQFHRQLDEIVVQSNRELVQLLKNSSLVY